MYSGCYLSARPPSTIVTMYVCVLCKMHTISFPQASVMNMLNRDLGTGDLCDNIGLVGVSAKWSYVTASPNHLDKPIRIFPFVVKFDLLVSNCLVTDLIVILWRKEEVAYTLRLLPV